ncbi:hypothetical protein KSS87_023196 [Heliosperma pusillum]|nr:hypothetical protein KSS87_023196 [Heliosperma pusillum]
MRFRFGSEPNDMDGFNASGVILLQKERSWLEQGQTAPLARNFQNISSDVESGLNEKDDKTVDGVDRTPRKLNPEAHQSKGSGEVIRNKYTVMREESGQPLGAELAENSIDTPSRLSSLWQTMKSGQA